jgi:hypothetical protein
MVTHSAYLFFDEDCTEEGSPLYRLKTVASDGSVTKEEYNNLDSALKRLHAVLKHSTCYRHGFHKSIRIVITKDFLNY